MTDTFKTLREASIARQKEWEGSGQIDLAFCGNELAGEVGEACNIIKKLERQRLGIKGSLATLDDLAEELADVIICSDLMAMHLDIKLTTDRSIVDSSVPTASASLSRLGSMMARAGGNVAGKACDASVRIGMPKLLDELIYSVHRVALMAGVDVDSTVATKFNATSEKYGLATRLATTNRD